MPDSVEYGFMQSLIQSLLNVVYVLVELSTIILILWMLYYDNYKYINTVLCVLLVSLIISLITVYVYALVGTSIAFKYVLLNFALIIINILDFVVENINKVLKYNRSKLNNTKDT